MTVSILSGLLGGILVGLVLIVVAWRGKRLNDHPICRSCQFDLLGILPEGVTCPECGAGLKRPNSYRTGARRKRWVTMAVGAVLVFTPIATIGTVGFGVLTGKDFNAYKPTWLLIWEGKHLSAEASQLAATELEARTFKPGTAADMVVTIVQAALDIQGDAERPWNQTWGDIITGAISSETLSEEDTKRYTDQAIVTKMETRLRVEAGGVASLVLTATDGRVGGSSMMWGLVYLGECTLDGKALSQANPAEVFGFMEMPDNMQLGWLQAYGATVYSGWGGGTLASGQAVATLNVPKETAPGRHTLHVEMKVNTMDQSGMTAVDYSGGPDEDSRLIVGDFEIEVVAEGVSTVVAIAATPDMTQRMTDAISISEFSIFPGGLLSSAQANMSVTFMDPPEELACDVIVKQGEREWPLGSLTTGTLASQDMSNGGWYQQDEASVTVTGTMSGIKSGAVSVILRPSADVAERTIDITRYYGGEIVISEVDVQNYGGSTGFLGALFQHFSEQAAVKAAEEAEREAAESSDDSPDESATEEPGGETSGEVEGEAGGGGG